MFNLFHTTHRRVGIEIASGAVNFVEVARRGRFERISAYGSAPVASVHPDDPTLAQAFAAISKVVQTKHVTIAVDDPSSAQQYARTLRKAGLWLDRALPVGQAVGMCAVPAEADSSFLVIHVSPVRTDFIMFGPREPIAYLPGETTPYGIVSAINRICIGWYDKHGSKIDHVILVGERAEDQMFVDYLARETRLLIHRANIFANMELDPAAVPMIPKKESYRYAAAAGAALG